MANQGKVSSGESKPLEITNQRDNPEERKVSNCVNWIEVDVMIMVRPEGRGRRKANWQSLKRPFMPLVVAWTPTCVRVERWWGRAAAKPEPQDRRCGETRSKRRHATNRSNA